MIVYRYIFKETFLTLLGVTAVMVLIFSSHRFVRYLADVATGLLPGDIIFTLIGLKVISQAMVVLPISFYLAVLLCMGRLYKDSEMVAMASCGIGPTRVLKGIFIIAPAVAILVGFISLYAGPWAQDMNDKIRNKAEQTSELSSLAAGQFTEFNNGRMIIYMEDLSNDQKRMKNVFVQSRSSDVPTVLSSDSANRYTDPESGNQYMVMQNGYRYEGSAGKPDFKIIKFAKHAVIIKKKKLVQGVQDIEAMSTADLWASTNKREAAELQWRISMPLSVLLLALMALPISRLSPREGRYARLFVAILIYIVYNNLMLVARDMVKTSAVPEFIGIWWVHLLLLITAITVLVIQLGPRWVHERIMARLPGKKATNR